MASESAKQSAAAGGRSWLIRLGAAVVMLGFGGGAFLFFTRQHTIVYRASALDCTASAVYAIGGEATRREEFSGTWESAPVAIPHGDTASVVISPERGCPQPMSCELMEDGHRVSKVSGRSMAICTAWTGR